MKDISSYKAVLLDIDDTVYDYEQAHSFAIERVFQELPVFLEHLEFHDFLSTYRAHRSRVTGQHAGSGASRSRFLAFQGLLEDMNVAGAYGMAFDAEELYWATLIENMEPSENLIDVLGIFAKGGGRICAVTDMQARVQVRKLRALGIDGFVSHMVSSEEIGVEKPNPTMFTSALEKLAVTPAEAIMIGDSLEKDISGAAQLGIDTWHFRAAQ